MASSLINKLMALGYQILDSNDWAIIFKDSGGIQAYMMNTHKFIKIDTANNSGDWMLNEYFLSYKIKEYTAHGSWTRCVVLNSEGKDLTARFKADMRAVIKSGCKIAAIAALRRTGKGTLIFANSAGKTKSIPFNSSCVISDIVEQPNGQYLIQIADYFMAMHPAPLGIIITEDLRIIDNGLQTIITP